MGSNSVQAQSIVLLLIAFVLLAVGFATGGSVVYIIIAILAFGLSGWRFQKSKSSEEESGKAGK
jgi:4-amino-4-deoxy-L-arabinose transferase-like glycosyltransferase